jgi:hypothetical protein
MTTYSTVGFADTPPEDVRDASTLLATSQAMAIGLSVAVATVFLRIGGGTGRSAYVTAFLLLAAIAVVPAVEAVRMSRDAGDAARRRFRLGTASTIQGMSARTTDRILADFETWATGQRLPLAGSAEGVERGPRERTPIRALLTGRANLLGKPDPARWRSGDVHEVLMQFCPARQLDVWGIGTHAPTELREFLRFLAETGRLHPGSTRVSTLIKELDRLVPNFGAAMADRSRWRLAKRVMNAMRDDDVDLDDPAAVDQWAVAFSARSAQERRPVLGELIDSQAGLGYGTFMIYDGEVVVLEPGPPQCRLDEWPYAECTCGECPTQVYPAISLPDETQLAKAVPSAGSGLFTCLLAFARWVSTEGRPVDQHGLLRREAVREAAQVFELDPADRLSQLPALSRFWDLCLEFGILELRHARVVPGPAFDTVHRIVSGEAPADEALTLWCDLFDEMSSKIQIGGNGELDSMVRALAGPWPPRLFAHLYASSPQGEAIGFADLVKETLHDHPDEFPPNADHSAIQVITGMGQMTFGYVAEHGGVQTSGWTPPAFPADSATLLEIESLLSGPPSRLRVQLTDLGRYAMRRQLLRAGATAPATMSPLPTQSERTVELPPVP